MSKTEGLCECGGKVIPTCGMCGKPMLDNEDENRDWCTRCKDHSIPELMCEDCGKAAVVTSTAAEPEIETIPFVQAAREYGVAFAAALLGKSRREQAEAIRAREEAV